jgi:hypothetical protein
LMKRYEAPQKAESKPNMTQDRRDIGRGWHIEAISPNEAFCLVR